MFGDGTDLIKHRKKVRACRNFFCSKLAKPLSFFGSSWPAAAAANLSCLLDTNYSERVG
jgi:hypothetical protein